MPIKSHFNYRIGSSTPPTDIDVLLNSLFDHRSNAANARNINGDIAQHGEEVYSMDELAVNGVDELLYGGADIPNATRKKPIKYVHEDIGLHMVYMANEFEILYASVNRPYRGIIGEDWLIIGRSAQEVAEAIVNGFYFRPYIAEGSRMVNDEHLRTTSDGQNNIRAVLPQNQVIVLRFKYVLDGLASPERVSTYMEINGVLQDGANHRETYLRLHLAAGFGAETNCAQYGFIDHFSKFGSHLTDAQVAQVYAAINPAYGIGHLIQKPFASNINYTKVNNLVSFTYTYNNPLGYPEDTSKRMIQIGATCGGIQDFFFFPENENLMTFDLNTMVFTKPDPTKEHWVPVRPGDDTTGLTLIPATGIRASIRVMDTHDNVYWVPQELSIPIDKL